MRMARVGFPARSRIAAFPYSPGSMSMARRMPLVA